MSYALCVGGQGYIVAVAADLSCINAALQAGSHWTAHGLAGKGVFKKSSLFCNGIEIGSDGELLTVAACGIGSLLVGKIENYVRLLHNKFSLSVY